MTPLRALSILAALGCGSPPPAPGEFPAAAIPVVPAAIENPTATETPAATENPTATETPAATENPTATENPAVTETPPALEPPTADEVDLLHAVPGRIAVSSAYRDDADQVSRIADGDLSSAWNSRTGDLVGGWIEVEVPAEAHVRAMAMTVGFTRASERSDLFLGNHRISRVRLSRAGEVLGEHDLDTTVRTPVEIPVGGPGGTLRIEVLATVPGTRTDWQELCVSEIQVLGTAPGANAGALQPSMGVGAVVPGRTDEAEDDLPEVDEEEQAEEMFQMCSMLLLDWDTYAITLNPFMEDGRGGDAERQRLAGAIERHRVLFTRAADLFVEVSPEAVQDATTRARRTLSMYDRREEDLAALLAGCDGLMAPHPTRACGWGAQRAYSRLQLIVIDALDVMLRLETNVETREDADGMRLRGEALEQVRADHAVATAFNGWLDRIHAGDWDELGHRQRATLLSSALPPPAALASRWALVRADVEAAEAACTSGH